MDGGFEEGVDNPYWETFSSLGKDVSPICDFECDNFNYAHSGDWVAWFGGWDDPESAWVSQSVTLPEGTATLTFWLRVEPGGSGLSDLSVTLGGAEVFYIHEDDADKYYDAWVQVTVDVSKHAGGGPQDLVFFGFTVPGGEGKDLDYSSFFVDDVSLIVQ
jgi:hypothetical protein